MCQKFEDSQNTQRELIRPLGHVRQVNIGASSMGRTMPLENTKVASQLNIHRSRMDSNYKCKIRKVHKLGTCQLGCPCNCHWTQCVRTPWTGSKCFGLGLITIASRHVPHKSNVQVCEKPAAPFVKIDYVLPTWFMFRMISMWFKSSSLSGPEFLVWVPCCLSRHIQSNKLWPEQSIST